MYATYKNYDLVLHVSKSEENKYDHHGNIHQQWILL